MNAVQSVLLFANPIAGQGRAKRIAAALRRTLTARGYTVLTFLQRPDDTPADAFGDLDHIAAAISIGGDGTLRAVAQLLFDRFGPERIPPIVVVPLGTANLMSKHLGIAWSDRNPDGQIADAIAQRRVAHLDAATANGRLFLLMAGVGIDAQIVHELDRTRAGPIDITSYALPAALAFQSYSYTPIEVEIDGKAVFGPAPALAFIGNVREYGTGFPVLPMARSDDGALDVCILPCRSRVELLKLILLVATGEHIGAEGVIYTTARRVGVRSNETVPVQIDGEAAGHTPLKVEMLDARIPFIVEG